MRGCARTFLKKVAVSCFRLFRVNSPSLFPRKVQSKRKEEEEMLGYMGRDGKRVPSGR